MGNKHSVVSVTDTGETGRYYEILREVPSSDSTKVEFYCRGVVSPYAGRARWVTLTKANTDAQKDAAIRAALLA